jgi:prepilin-type N-terminal cleavage/methylation domain-containing protein
MRPYSNRSQRGFSLLEILVAVAIISIVLAMGMLNYSTILPNYKANSAMDQLLYQLRSARERAIAHRREVQVQFSGTNQLTITELWLVGTAPPASTVSFEGGAQYIVFGSPVTDIPAPYNFGNTNPIYFGGLSGGPPVMKFSTTGSFIDGGNTLVNGTVFMGIPGKPSTARAISVLGATGRVREYHWDGTQWQE